MRFNLPSKKLVLRILGLLLVYLISLAITIGFIVVIEGRLLPFFKDSAPPPGFLLIVLFWTLVALLSPAYPESKLHQKKLRIITARLLVIMASLVLLEGIVHNWFSGNTIQIILAIILSGLCLAFPVIFKNAFYNESLAKILQKSLDKTRLALCWRGSRVGIFVARTIFSIISMIFISICLAATVNVLEPNTIPIEMRTFTGPAASPMVNALLLDAQDGTLYAGTSGGVFRSRDAGQTWETANVGLTDRHVNALLQDTRNDTLYAGTSGGIFRSRDTGQTWEAAGTGLTTVYVNALLQDSRDGALYAGTLLNGVFRSHDAGKTWEATSEELTNTFVFSLLQDSRDGTLYAGTSGGVFRSHDAGQTWEAANAGLSTGYVNALLQDSRDGTLYAGGMSIWAGGDWIVGSGVFRSRDAGQTWEATSAGLANTSVRALLQDSRDGTFYAGTDGGIFRSRDAGQTWEVTSAGLANTSVSALLQQGSRDSMLYAGTNGGGVFRSRDAGQTWEAANAGFTTTHVDALLQDSRDGTLYAGTNGGGVFRSRDAGQTWEATSAGLANTSVRALLQDSRNVTLYAGTNGGVFCSRDAGQTWETASTGLTTGYVNALLQDSRDDTLYAGTNGGVFRSRNGGQTWETANAGLSDTFVFSLLQDSRDGTLYAGTEGGVFRSRDAGQTWVASHNRIGVYIKALLQDSRDGTLYAGTDGLGFFRSRDAGQTWEIASTGLTTGYVNALLQLQDSRDGTLYAGTNDGVFRSHNAGQTWEAVIAGLTATHVDALLQDNRDGTLYAGTDGDGVFRSHDAGQTWEATSAGLTSTVVNALLQLQDSHDDALYAGTDGGIFRSRDAGQTWKSVIAGLTTVNVNALLQDNRDGTLYAVINDGMFRSRDAGQTWESAIAGLNNSSVFSLLQDSRDGTLYAGADGGVFSSRDAGQTWEATSTRLATFVDTLQQDSRNGTLYAGTRTLFINMSGSDISGTSDSINYDIFRSHDAGQTWTQIGFSDYYAAYANMPEWVFSESIAGRRPNWFLDNLVISVFEYQSVNPDATHYYSFGATILEIPPEPNDPDRFLPFWALRTWTELWFKPRWLYFVGPFGAFLLLLGLASYTSATWTLKTPVLYPSKAQQIILNAPSEHPATPTIHKWQEQIRGELLTFGDAHPDDLLNVSFLLRGAVIHSYYQRYEDEIALQLRGQRLSLLAGTELKNWQSAWQLASEDFGRKAGLSERGRSQVAALAQALAGRLGFSLGEHREVGSALAWRVEAPALRLNLPERFPLVFVADPNPGPETIRQLFDTVSVLKETSNFTLVIPLEPEEPAVDIPFSLRRAIDASPYAHDFVVLSHQDALDILVARYPERVLVRHISRQVDLSFISPFVVNGPVPPQMFFGRDREIRNLVDHAGRRNFAVVGNRKIGKTSLLNRVEARLFQQDSVRLVRLDCQTVREAADFYAILETGLGISLEAGTPSALGAGLRTVAASSALPLVLVLDEVDALLAVEKARGEGLLSVLRELANEKTCSFIFCGSKVLAQQLRDPESALFNFPETIPLPYLAHEEMDDVIIRPLETLGIRMDDSAAVLDAVWALTSGHPNLTQFVGRALVNAANERQDRLVRREDVETLWTDAAFVQFYFDTIWGAASPLEKLVTLLMPPDNFSVGDVEKALSTAGADVSAAQVDSALEMLLVYSVFGRSGKLYRFIPQAFHKLLDLNYEKERLLARELEKLTTGGAS